jgi:hypothetical protein
MYINIGKAGISLIFGLMVAIEIFSLPVLLDSEPAADLLRGPYLQKATPASIVVRWRTVLAESSRVVYGGDAANMNLEVLDLAAVTEHEVTVVNLLPETRYTYAVGSETRLLAGEDGSCVFWTHPLPGHPTPLRVWVTGDAGSTYSYQFNVRDAFESMNNGHLVNAWLQLGDNAYNEGTDAQYQAGMFDVYGPRLKKTTVWPALGNHDAYSLDWNGVFPYLNIFSLPTEGESGGVASHTELYYSFDVGMAHFVCLDSMSSSRTKTGVMANWLRADLAANTNRWLIAFFHHPPYTKGSHNSDTEHELIEMRENFVPILESGGVDLVLSGHSHSYERSYFLDGHTGHSATLNEAMIRDSGSGAAQNGGTAYIKPGDGAGENAGNQGAVYAVVGSSGKISGGPLNHPAMHTSLNKAGSLVMELTYERLDALFLRDTGATNDWFSIVKPSGALVASNQLVNVSADTPASLYLSSSSNPVSFAVKMLPANGVISDFDSTTGAFVYTPAHGSTNNDSFVFFVSDGQLVSYPGTVGLQIDPLADSDKDGMPDTWESSRGVTDPNEDFDRDGVSNLDEYRSNTNPKDKSSWLHMSGVSIPSSGFQVNWASIGGVRYRIMYSDGVGSGGFNGVFTPLPQPADREMDSAPAGTPGTMSFVDNYSLTGGPPATGRRFFRVQVVN